MRCYHYHRYDNANRPVVSVCLVYDREAGVFSRGIAICSPRDYGSLTNKKGKMIARNRALIAARDKANRGEINREATISQLVYSSSSDIVLSNNYFKSAYGVNTTPFERAEYDIEDNLVPIKKISGYRNNPCLRQHMGTYFMNQEVLMDLSDRDVKGNG